jgi:hypothetical protein
VDDVVEIEPLVTLGHQVRWAAPGARPDLGSAGGGFSR